LTTTRAALHIPTQTVVVADLHLGYDRVRRRGGEAVPVRSIAQELALLQSFFLHGEARRLLIAGDLFEDGRYQGEEMIEELLTWLHETGVELVGVIPGNHDRGISTTSLPIFAEGMDLGGWRIVHGDGAVPSGAFAQGHEHPYLRWSPGVEGPCYLVASGHLVLPAYSADAAGGNVLSQSRWERHRCCVIAGGQMLDFGEVSRLRAKRAEESTR
jgi:hypothetical protein